jgi:hypothetical protein
VLGRTKKAVNLSQVNEKRGSTTVTSPVKVATQAFESRKAPFLELMVVTVVVVAPPVGLAAFAVLGAVPWICGGPFSKLWAHASK